MKFLVLTLSIAHAGWWSDFCEKHLIADDPYQYESISTSWIEWKIYILETMHRNKVADGADLRMLEGLKKELERRADGV